MLFSSAQKGYVFNDESGKLESYQFVSAVIGLDEYSTQELRVSVHAIVGGKEKDFVTAPNVYKDENAFKEGDGSYFAVEYRDVKLGLKLHVNQETTWVFGNGKAEEIRIKDLEVYAAWDNDNLSYTCKYPLFYDSESEVYQFNNIRVIEEDGTEREIICNANLLALTPEQNKLVAEFEELLKRMEDANIYGFADSDAEKVGFVNKANIDIIEYAGPCEYSQEPDYINLYNCARFVSTDVVEWLGYETCVYGKMMREKKNED